MMPICRACVSGFHGVGKTDDSRLERLGRVGGPGIVIGEVVDHLLDAHRILLRQHVVVERSCAQRRRTPCRHRSRRSRPAPPPRSSPGWLDVGEPVASLVAIRARCLVRIRLEHGPAAVEDRRLLRPPPFGHSAVGAGRGTFAGAMAVGAPPFKERTLRYRRPARPCGGEICPGLGDGRRRSCGGAEIAAVRVQAGRC